MAHKSHTSYKTLLESAIQAYYTPNSLMYHLVVQSLTVVLSLMESGPNYNANEFQKNSSINIAKVSVVLQFTIKS